jgi:hypothetical protein
MKLKRYVPEKARNGEISFSASSKHCSSANANTLVPKSRPYRIAGVSTTTAPRDPVLSASNAFSMVAPHEIIEMFLIPPITQSTGQRHHQGYRLCVGIKDTDTSSTYATIALPDNQAKNGADQFFFYRLHASQCGRPLSVK